MTVTSGDFTDHEGNEVEHLLRITEIFVGADGQRLFRANWFYKAIDTAMAVREPGRGGAERRRPALAFSEARRVWLATVEDNEGYAICFSLDHIGV